MRGGRRVCSLRRERWVKTNDINGSPNKQESEEAPEEPLCSRGEAESDR